MNPESYCIPHRKRLLGQTTKQPLSYFEPWTLWKYKQLWGLRPEPSCLLVYKCIIEKLTSSTKRFPQNADKLFCHTHRQHPN